MKKLIAFIAIALIGIVASPFALGVLALLIAGVLGVVVGVVGLVAAIIAWAIPLAIAAGVSVLAFVVITHLLDS